MAPGSKLPALPNSFPTRLIGNGGGEDVGLSVSRQLPVLAGGL